MNRLNVTALLFLFCLLTAFAVAGPPAPVEDKFKLDCPAPFEATPTKRPIDKTCPNDGKFVDNDTPEHHEQNRAKNGLCAVGSGGEVQKDPIPVTLSTFDQLEAKVLAKGIDFGGSDNLPKDRKLLRENMVTNASGIPVAEGSYVVFVGKMLENHATGVESVNCSLPGVRNFDIHIALVGQGETNPCKSVTAEIIPHYRPDSWYNTYFKKTYKELQDHPWRVKGQMFFDGSHRPCNDPLRGSKDPLRRSSWEIHPVYSIDICANTTVASCKADDESKWTPLDEWMASH